jgi:hypothetical protein
MADVSKELIAPKKTRTSASKVRTGCVTCKCVISDLRTISVTNELTELGELNVTKINLFAGDV